jgi:hypothetical protein
MLTLNLPALLSQENTAKQLIKTAAETQTDLYNQGSLNALFDCLDNFFLVLADTETDLAKPKDNAEAVNYINTGLTPLTFVSN